MTAAGEPGNSVLTSRIGRRLLALFTGCALLPLAVFAWVATSRTTQQMRSDLQASLHNGAKTAGMGIAARLSQVVSDLALARQLRRHAQVAGVPVDAASLQQHVGERCAGVWLQSGGGIDSLFGESWLGDGELTPPELAHLGAGKPLVRAGPSMRLVMMVAVEPAHPDRELFVAAIRESWLWDAEELRAAGSDCAVFDSRWRNLFHTFPTLPDVQPLVAAASPRGANASAGTVDWQAHGEPSVARYWKVFLRPQYAFDLFVVQSRPQRDAFRVIDSFSRTFALTAIGTLLLVVCASMVQIRRTLKPIVLLHAATQRVKSGDLEARVALDGRDEFGDLGSAFNDMTAELQENVRRRAATERELVASRDEALAAVRAKAEFVTNVSHEFRTPMMHILSAAEILCGEGIDDPTRVEFAGMALHGAQRLARLVDDVLELGSSTPWQLSPTRPEATVADALARLPQVVRERIRLDLAKDLPPVAAAVGRLTEVWMRLLDNAAKFSPVESPIDVRMRCAGDQLVTEVVDYGVGISRLDYQRIFEPFCQVGRDQLTDKASGTGLGLTLARNAIERHGGRIEVDSELGNGATFRVYLPIHRPRQLLPLAAPVASDLPEAAAVSV